MTDQELIKALRYCGSSDEASCRDCPAVKECHGSIGILTATIAADRLEALLAENAELNIQIQKEIVKRVDVEAEDERLKAQLPKWVSVDEYLPVLTEKEIDLIEKFGIEFAPEYVVLIKGADKPTALRFDGEKWFDDNGTWYRVECWHSLHELPGTEEVEQWARRF